MHPSVEPEPRQRRAESAVSTAMRSRAQRGAIARRRGARPRSRSRPTRRPRRGTTSARTAATVASSPGASTIVATATPPLAIAGSASCRAIGAVEPMRLGVDEPAVAADAPAVEQAACRRPSRPWRSGRTRRPPRAEARASSRELDVDACASGARGRTGSSPAAARRARRRRPTVSVTPTVGVGPERPIDLLGRRGGDHEPRASRRP